MIPRNDLRSPDAPEGVEIFQLTAGELPSAHVYMEAQIFLPDSRRFILQESATAHGGDRKDPRHRYLVCDLGEGGALRPITEETGATAPSVSPDGRHLYYLVDQMEITGGSVALKRVGLDGSGRETLLRLDSFLPGSRRRASRIYPLSTIRADGKRLAVSCFLGDGQQQGAPWGLMVFDLEKASVEVVLEGPTWCNMHPQYCRSSAQERMRDILVQENHGNVCSPTGEILQLVGGAGADIHVIRDDGADFRDMPWGRDGNESCMGHQCWRGKTDWAITSAIIQTPQAFRLIESRAVKAAGHAGSASPGGVRNDLSRSFPQPHFNHFGTDLAGRRLVTDAWLGDRRDPVYLAALGKAGEEAATGWACLAHPRSSSKKECHLHPVLSPDGARAFFNSDESGVLQAYMIQGLSAL